ncbi:MAG: RNA chaperone Hfq [Acidobacteriota bacterium]|nr:RNA chaperone Hfq [Acidobacteriota bacterium]
MANRKLVRPNLAEIKERLASRPPAHSPREGHQNGPAARRKPVPPEQTAAEPFYYLKQMNNKTAMVVVLDTGEEIRGHIEWYDRGCIKVHREDEPNMLIYKHSIKYLYKQEEEVAPRLVESSSES